MLNIFLFSVMKHFQHFLILSFLSIPMERCTDFSPKLAFPCLKTSPSSCRKKCPIKTAGTHLTQRNTSWCLHSFPVRLLSLSLEISQQCVVIYAGFSPHRHKRVRLSVLLLCRWEHMWGGSWVTHWELPDIQWVSYTHSNLSVNQYKSKDFRNKISVCGLEILPDKLHLFSIWMMSSLYCVTVNVISQMSFSRCSLLAERSPGAAGKTPPPSPWLHSPSKPVRWEKVQQV